MTIQDLPALNASLNALSTVFLTLGFIFIKRGQKIAHRNCMITAVITSAQPLNLSSLKVHWGLGAITDSLTMTATGNPNEYSASIPGPLSNVDVRYYIIAKDQNGGRATHPANAPTSYHQFHVGADVTPPIIVHAPIADFPLVSWPATVNSHESSWSEPVTTPS